MITLITGTPGSGKTLYAVTKILEYAKENEKLMAQGKEPRMIYANIDGLNIPNIEPAPDDWRTTPDGSIIFYDEIQQLEPYKKSRFDNQICDDLQIHRHTGHDIYGITQFPVLLHPNFRAVVGVHQHLHRGWGLSAATVFSWAYCVDAPNAPSNKKLAEHTFRFDYPKDVYKYYKSATIHTHKARIPKRMFLGVAVLFLFAYLAYNQLFNKNNFFTKVYGKQQTAQKAENNNEKPMATATITTTEPTKIDGTNTPTQAPYGTQGDNMAQNTIQGTNTPYSTPQAPQPPIPSQYELEQKYLQPYTTEVANFDTVRPAIVAQMGNDCIAYNQFGDKLAIDDSLCKSMLKEYGIRPKARQYFNQYNGTQYNGTQYNGTQYNGIQDNSNMIQDNSTPQQNPMIQDNSTPLPTQPTPQTATQPTPQTATQQTP